MGRRLLAAQLLPHPPKDSCGVTAITTAQKIQPITRAGKTWSKNTETTNGRTYVRASVFLSYDVGGFTYCAQMYFSQD